jgi:hypothetical protein
VSGAVAGRISMQSTGHTGTHSSQPVHSGSTTVCISLEAPMMQSTGQALMHSVQPMHQASSMTASARGAFAAAASVQRRDGAGRVMAASRT